jgi:hypothetical protein
MLILEVYEWIIAGEVYTKKFLSTSGEVVLT